MIQTCGRGTRAPGANAQYAPNQRSKSVGLKELMTVFWLQEKESSTIQLDCVFAYLCACAHYRAVPGAAEHLHYTAALKNVLIN